MIVLDKRLKYLFDYLPRETEYDEDLRMKIRVDKSVFRAIYDVEKIDKMFDENGELIRYNFDETSDIFIATDLKGLVPDSAKEDWDLIHLDGDYKNCNLNNLEPVFFVDENPVNKLHDKVKSLKKQIISQNKKIKELLSENKIKDIKVANMSKQVIYEQNKNKELNKEIKRLEKEVRRLFSIINSNKKE